MFLCPNLYIWRGGIPGRLHISKLQELMNLHFKIKQHSLFSPVSTGRTHLNFPEGTVLLETRLRYGELSYTERDLVTKESTWRPPEEISKSLQRKYATTREAEVKIEVKENNKIVQNVAIIYPWWHFRRYCAIL